MNFGTVLLASAFASAIAAALLYAPALFGRRAPRAADGALLIHVATLTAAMAWLAHLFIAHRFEYTYVEQYSSRALSPALSLAASWAGQEGSILLWALFGAWLAVALWRQPGSLTRAALSIVALGQVGLLTLAVVRNPFRMSSLTPTDGQGLNPLLNDPWMVAHPPLLFLGYAALLVPFALSIAALMRRDGKDWNHMVWPWALFGVLSLGVGIVLGGAWAYKVLGWGGYWGWDPVENASLVPWLLAIALLHGLLIQRATGALERTNHLLAMLGWWTVLGGTYLTRSGILQDFSVHSFADSGLRTPLTAFLLLSVGAGAVLLVARWRQVESPASNWLKVNRASALWIGLVTVVLLAVLVTVGTTAPLLTMMFGKPASVQAAFYERIIVPFGLAILLVMALAPALRWSRAGGGWFQMLLPGLAGGIVVFAIAYTSGARLPHVLGLAAATGLAIGMNLWMMARLFARGWRYGAGYLGHFGIAVMALGMLISGTLGRSERVRVPEGGTVQVLGHSLTFEGLAPGPMDSQEMRLKVAGKSWTLDAAPRLMAAPRGEGMIHTPAISMRRELYVSPLEIQQEGGAALPHSHDEESVWLEKGKSQVIDGVDYRFTGFRMESHQDLRVYADLEIRRGGKVERVAPYAEATAQGTQAQPLQVPGLGMIALLGLDADHGRVALHLPHGSAAAAAAGIAPPRSVAFLEFSTKPMINLVWIGALLTLVGTALAGVRRAVPFESTAPSTVRGRA